MTSEFRFVSSATLVVAMSLICGASLAQTEHRDSLGDQHQALIEAILQNYRTATPIEPIPADSITEEDAYRIADAYVARLGPTEGQVAGYKIGTFEAGLYDDGPVDGFSGPVTAVMFSGGLHDSGHHVSIDCCNFSFVEADFAAEVGSDSINDAETDREILTALRGFRPFIEMPDILRTAPNGSTYSGIATNYDFRNGIVGELVEVPATSEGLQRLRSFRYVMTNEDGRILGEGEIADAYDPVYRVRALRDSIVKRGRKLKAGDILSLGNMGTIRPLKPGIFMLDRPRFEGNEAIVTYIDLSDKGPVEVRVFLDR